MPPKTKIHYLSPLFITSNSLFQITATTAKFNPSMKAAFEDLEKLTDPKHAKSGHAGDDEGRNALLVKCEERLDRIGAHYTSTPFFVAMLPYILLVAEYTKWCLAQMSPGGPYFILQGKCPIPQKMADGWLLSLALGGNCPNEKCRSICTV